MRDTKEDLYCPACGKLMEKVFMEEQKFYLDICSNGCGGILFDNRELKHFDESHENIDKILEVLKDKEFIKTDESKRRICPVCNAPMVKAHTSANQSVVIDECYSCGAQFLDCGELMKIRSEFPTEEERIKCFEEKFYDLFGDEMQKAEEERQKAAQKRSFLRKLAVKIFEKH